MAYLCVRDAGGVCLHCPGEWLTCVCGMQVGCVFSVHANGLHVCGMQVECVLPCPGEWLTCVCGMQVECLQYPGEWLTRVCGV